MSSINIRRVLLLTPDQEIHMPHAFDVLSNTVMARTVIDDTDNIGEKAYAVKVEDDAMVCHGSQHSFNPGDTVIIDPDAKIRPGDFVRAVVGEEKAAILRKYRPRSTPGTYDLVPVNDDWATEHIGPQRPARIIGRVVKYIRNYY